METQIKYTAAGKKVIVLAEVESSKSFLVKEIYIADGKEIPLGEILQATELFNEVPVTWHEKRNYELREELEKEEKALKEKLVQFEKKKSLTIKALRGHLDSFQNLINTWNRNPHTEILYKTFDLLSAFVLDKIKYFVVIGYSTKIVEFKEYMFGKDGEICLLSIFGSDKGHLNWNVNQYRDGSGSSNRVIPCRTLKEAKEEFLNFVNSKEKYYEDEVKVARKYRIKLDPIKLQKLRDLQKSIIETQIKDFQNKVVEQRRELKRLQSKLRVR